MKALFVTVLIFAAAFAAYDYFGLKPGQHIIFKALNVAAEEGAVGQPVPQPVKQGPAADDPAAAVSTTPKVSSSEPPAPDTPAPNAANTPPAPSAAAASSSSGFVEPRYDSLEVLTKNWTVIPKTAFPRAVHLRKALPFKMSAGSSVINAGTEVTALGFEGGALTLAPAATSSARAQAGVDDTDLKALLHEGYERWKIVRTELMKKAYERRLAMRDQPDAPAAGGTDPAVAPARASDGTYPVLVAHLQSGDVHEIKLKNVHSWGDAMATQFEGKPAWSVKIQFDAETIFGLQPAEAQAIVSGGRVKGWFYTGSGEQVP